MRGGGGEEEKGGKRGRRGRRKKRRKGEEEGKGGKFERKYNIVTVKIQYLSSSDSYCIFLTVTVNSYCDYSNCHIK